MSRALLIAGAFAVASAAAVLTPALAAPVGGVGATDPLAQSLIVKTGPGRCWKWNAICRDRWVAGWKYRRCMKNHGCW
jgi:hypothetical protein